MKKTTMLSALATCLFLIPISFPVLAQTEKPLQTEKDKISYVIGISIARSLAQIKDEIDLEKIVSGIQDQFHGKPIQVTDEESQVLMQEFSARMKKKQDQKNKELAQKATEEGTRFLAENRKREGVMTTDSGLQYAVLKQGSGPKPANTDRVKVHYKGTTIDGEEFDSSYKRGEPAAFSITGVIKGWTEALLLMNVGSKYKLVIPSDLAYGERGAGPKIGPNQVLIFEVELLGIED